MPGQPVPRTAALLAVALLAGLALPALAAPAPGQSASVLDGLPRVGGHAQAHVQGVQGVHQFPIHGGARHSSASGAQPAGAAATSGASTTADLRYFGGAVQVHPKVEVLFWGWHSSDPDGAAARLTTFLGDLGGSTYAEIQTQYRESSRGFITNPTDLYVGSVVDDTDALPSNSASEATWADALANEAALVSAYYGYDADADVVVALPSGHAPPDFGNVYCAWHSWFLDGSSRPVAFTNLPYQPDAGVTCGAGMVNGFSGLLDGVTINAGHEVYEAVTDPFPRGDSSGNTLAGSGWTDGTGVGEDADKCAWSGLTAVTLGGNAYPVQPLYSNHDHACVTAATFAHLSVQAGASPDPGMASQPLDLTFTVHNGGALAAIGVTLAASWPAGFGYQSGNVSQGSCPWVVAGLSVACSLGTLAAGADATLHVSGLPAAAGNLALGATAGSGLFEPDTSHDHAAASVAVLPAQSDLAVSLHGSAPSLFAGQPLLLTANVTNAGPLDAPSAKLKVTLPSGMAYGAITPSQGACTRVAAMATCALGALPDGAHATVTFALVPTRAAAAAKATATVSTLGPADPLAGNNKATAVTQVLAPHADLNVIAADAPDPAVAGVTLVYTVNVTNAGPDDAPGVALKAMLPSGMAYGAITPSQGACTRVSSAATCLLGPLANGATASVAFAMVPTRAADAARLTATAKVTGGGVDPVAANNRAVQSTQVLAAHADLNVTLDAAPQPVAVGQAVTYTAHVRNDGPDGAPAVTLTQTLPAGLSYGAAVPSQGQCVRSATLLTCSFGALASGVTATVSLAGTTSKAGVLTSVATGTVSAGGVDGAPGNNKATAVTTVQ